MTKLTEEKTALPAKEKKPASSRKFPVFSILLLILIIAVGGYFQFRLEGLILQNGALNQDLQRLSNQIQSQQKQSGVQQQKHEQDKQQIQALTAQLDLMHQTLQQIPGARAEDWKLAEVEYLMRLANQRVSLQQEVRGALGLFNAADDILAELDDPGLLPVREQVAKELLALNQVAMFDRQGIYLQLQAIKSQVHESIQPPTNYQDISKTLHHLTADTSQESAPAPSSQWVQLWEKFLGLVSIRHRDQAFDAPLSQEQYQLLEHSLILMLEQAQWALMKADQSLFDSSLANAHQWIDGKLRHQQALSLLNAVAELQTQNISPKLPDVSQSLLLLRQVLNARIYSPKDQTPAVQPKANTNNTEKPAQNKPSAPTPQPPVSHAPDTESQSTSQSADRVERA